MEDFSTIVDLMLAICYRETGADFLDVSSNKFSQQERKIKDKNSQKIFVISGGFNGTSLLGKFGKIVYWRPRGLGTLLRGILDPPLIIAAFQPCLKG